MDAEPAFHALFSPLDGVSPDDFEPEPIATIHVVRYDVSGPKHALRAFAPEELPDLARLGQMFGSGTYELTARRPGGTIYAKRRYTIEAGPSKSMSGDPVDTSAPAPAPVTPAPASGGLEAFAAAGQSPFALMLLMMQQSREDAARRDALALQAQQQQSQMMIATIQAIATMATGGKQEASTIVAATVQAMGQMQSKPDPAANLAHVRDVIGLARELAPPPPPPPPKVEPPDDLPQILGAVASMVQGFAAMAPSAPAAAAPAAAVVNPAG